MAAIMKRRGRDGSTHERAPIDDELDALGRAPDFAGCSRSELERIYGMATEVRCPAGVILQTAGRGVRQVVVLLEGEVIERARGITRWFGPSHVIGSDALHRLPALASSSVATATPVRALVLSPPDVAEVAAIRRGGGI